MDEESYLEPCVTLDVTTPGFLLAVCQNDGKKPITLETLGCYQHIVQMPVRLGVQLVKTYYCGNSRSLIAIRYAERS